MQLNDTRPKRGFNIRVTPRAILLVVLGAALAIGCGAAFGGQPEWFKEQEKTSDKIAQQLIKATPYPTAEMKVSLERENLKRRLLAFNDPNKIGYVYIMSFGKFVGYYTIKGKVSSVQSQMTNADQTWDCGSSCETIVGSIGDDGSFGPNEGGDAGVFFYTTDGVLVETTLEWLYSDQVLAVDAPNLLK